MLLDRGGDGSDTGRPNIIHEVNPFTLEALIWSQYRRVYCYPLTATRTAVKAGKIIFGTADPAEVASVAFKTSLKAYCEMAALHLCVALE